jgi:hypothetical protein
MLGPRRRVDVDLGALVVGWSEKWEPLRMIHVEMAEEQVELIDTFFLEFQAKLTDSGARIQHNDARPATDFDARRVATAT